MNTFPLATMRPPTRAQGHLLNVVLTHPGRAKSRLQVLGAMTTSKAARKAFGGLLDRGSIWVDLVPEPR